MAEFMRRGRGVVYVRIAIPAERYDGLCALAQSSALALRALRLGIPRYVDAVEASLVRDGRRPPAQPEPPPCADASPRAAALDW